MGSVIPYTQEAYELFHQGALAFASLEANGIRVDEDYLATTVRKLNKRIGRLEDRLKTTEVAKLWQERFGTKTNFESNPQLGTILFDIMKFPPPALTNTGKYSVDERSLGQVDHPFVKDYLKIKKLQKIAGTYLGGIQREVVDGFIHPFFNLNIPRSMRSSSNAINFHNQPLRNPKLGRLVRLCFIAREGHCLVEVDISSAEVLVATCYHQDPMMVGYLQDKTKDMHRDMSRECYLLDEEEMMPVDDKDAKRIKRIRLSGKNNFVFAQFYGSYFLACAKDLWDAIDELGLRLRNGDSLHDHLASKGITQLGHQTRGTDPRPGTFEYHIKKVEDRFWNERFPVYKKWREDWVKQYRERGWMKTKTGFICQGAMARNKIINYPIQGASFHCLLKVVNWLVLSELRKRKMRALIVGQIHDSLLGDVPEEEIEEFVHLVRRLFSVRLPKVWPWLILPMEVGAEITPVNGSWADKGLGPEDTISNKGFVPPHKQTSRIARLDRGEVEI